MWRLSSRNRILRDKVHVTLIADSHGFPGRGQHREIIRAGVAKYFTAVSAVMLIRKKQKKKTEKSLEIPEFLKKKKKKTMIIALPFPLLFLTFLLVKLKSFVQFLQDWTSLSEAHWLSVFILASSSRSATFNRETLNWIPSSSSVNSCWLQCSFNFSWSISSTSYFYRTKVNIKNPVDIIFIDITFLIR